MVIRDLDVPGSTFPPFKADPPLIIHSNTILPATITSELFQTVRWRAAQVKQTFGRLQ
jgi:hypothetical protein